MAAIRRSIADTEGGLDAAVGAVGRRLLPLERPRGPATVRRRDGGRRTRIRTRAAPVTADSRSAHRRTSR
ncbi:hypothetical protein AMK13_18360 [Streptomyces sp. CB02056]|nr:hypothetical protein AMK13_18360 [Streptomyces sp. CB02056]